MVSAIPQRISPLQAVDDDKEHEWKKPFSATCLRTLGGGTDTLAPMIRGQTLINLERAQGETRVMRADFTAGGRGSFFVDSASENSVQRHRAEGNDANRDFQTSQKTY